MPKRFNKQEQAFIQKVRQTAGKAINQYKMIGGDDTVMVAVSGGKDSLSLLEILSSRRKGMPVTYQLHAAHIITDDIPYQIDTDWLRQFCTDLDVTLHLVHTRADTERDGKKKPCFVCSKNRRKELFQLTHSLGIKKLAFGHHLDDAVETLVMNMTQHANISSIPPQLEMFDGKLELIRPLIFLMDAEMKRYADLMGFQSLKQSCPYEDHTIRKKARDIVEQMTGINPKARINLFNSMKRIDFEYLP